MHVSDSREIDFDGGVQDAGSCERCVTNNIRVLSFFVCQLSKWSWLM